MACSRTRAGFSATSSPAPAQPQTSPRHGVGQPGAGGTRGTQGTGAALLCCRPSNARCVGLQGKGPRGEEGALSTEEVPKDRVSVELHDAKMSQSALFTF